MSLILTVFLSKNGSAPRQVVLCGVDKVNTSASVCVQIARALAAKGARRVCLVDSDQDASKLRQFLPTISAAHAHGSRVLVEGSLWLALIEEPHHAPQLLSELRSGFDHIIINAPGVNDGGFAAMLGQGSDGAILVIEASSTRKVAAQRAKSILAGMNVPLLGTVLNNRTFPIPEMLYRRL